MQVSTVSIHLLNLNSGDVSSLWVTIDGETSPPKMFFNVEVGEYTVQCIAGGFNPKALSPTIRFFIGNQLLNVTDVFIDTDEEASAAVRAQRFR